MTRQDERQCPRSGIPDPDCSVLTGRSEPREGVLSRQEVEGFESERGDPFGMPEEGLTESLTCLRGPETDLKSQLRSSQRRGGLQLTCPSCPPVATIFSLESHSTQSTHPLCPDKVHFGVSISMSHIRQVASPEPVAAYFPVGECAQQRMGEA